jgi:hypothetical protein
MFDSMKKDATELLKMLVASPITAKSKLNTFLPFI